MANARICRAICGMLFLLLLPKLCRAQVDYIVVNQRGIDETPAVLRVSPDGKDVSIIGRAFALAVAADKNGNIFAAYGSIFRITPQGPVTVFSDPEVAGVGRLAIDRDGNFILADNQANVLWRISPDGKSRTLVSPIPLDHWGELRTIGVAIDRDGNYIVSAPEIPARKHHLSKITPAGQLSTIGDQFPIRTSGHIAIDAAGNYIIPGYATSDMAGIIRVSPAGVAQVVQLAPPLPCCISAIAVDPLNGNYIVTQGTETTVYRLLAVTPAGAVTTVLEGGRLTRPAGIVIVPRRPPAAK